MRITSDIHSLIDALDDPILLVSDGRVSVANSAAETVLGRIVPGSDVRLAIRHPAALDRIASGNASKMELTGISTSDRPWLVEVSTLGDGTVLVRLVDRSAARAAERMRVDFVANASHELKTPLSTILGYADTIAEDGDLDSVTHARFGDIIRGEARRMLRIIDDLMSLSRIEADRFSQPSDEVALAEIAEIAAANGRELAEQRTCEIEVDAAPDLPPVRGDFAQLLQMADNLVTNAIRYGCAQRACRIRISVRRDRGELLFSVSDDGEGIPPQHLTRLTERFYRVDDSRSRDTGGTGLGLAIVKHIVERHRGMLEIVSAPGRGTTVKARLPRA